MPEGSRPSSINANQVIEREPVIGLVEFNDAEGLSLDIKKTYCFSHPRNDKHDSHAPSECQENRFSLRRRRRLHVDHDQYRNEKEGTVREGVIMNIE